MIIEKKPQRLRKYISHRGHRDHRELEKQFMKQQDVINNNCCIAYFDILGFKDELSFYDCQLNLFVEDIYEKVLKTIEEGVGPWRDTIRAAWFSDTFFFFSFDDTIESLSSISRIAHNFFDLMIMEKIPLRGALSVGDFYADEKSNIYIGPAIVDAYKFSEKQDWIGFILTPSITQTFKGIGSSDYYSDIESLFVQYNVPLKKKKDNVIQESDSPSKLYAYKYNSFLGNLSWLEEIIKEMYTIAKNRFGKDKESVYNKYDNTLKFIEYLKQESCAKH